MSKHLYLIKVNGLHKIGVTYAPNNSRFYFLNSINGADGIAVTASFNTEDTMSLIVESRVRAIAKEYGRRVGKPFMTALNELVDRKLRAACRTHNGGKVTLDAGVARQLGMMVKDKEAGA